MFIYKFICFLISFYCLILNAEEQLTQRNDSLQKEILRMYEEDLKLRQALVDANFNPEIGKKVWEIDNFHLKRLKEIIEMYGWPGYKLVGENGSDAMWLLVQHTPEREFQKECLKLLRKAVTDKDASPKNLAYLEDRTLVYEDKKQIYGTQWKKIYGKHVLHPVEDFHHLNERRLSIGLNTIEESRQEMIQTYNYSDDDFLLEMDDELKNSLFTEYIKTNAIRIDELENLPAEKFQFLSNYKAILLGEIHGINETPALTLGMIKLLSKANKPIILAIEVWDSQQDTFQQFLQTGDVDHLKNSPFFTFTPQYGIASAAMVNLLQEVRRIPNIQIFCFENSNREITNQNERIMLSQERDFLMAQKLNKKFQENENAILVVLTGSVHASTQINSILGEDYKPMGYWLSHQENSTLKPTDILSINLKFEQGKSWCGIAENGGEITFGLHEWTPEVNLYSQSVDLDKYFLLLEQKEDGYDAVFFNRIITPSLPAYSS